MRTLVQCDFDGTITEKDVGFLLLDTFAAGNWRQLHKEYEEAGITVGRFNRDAFAMVRADRQSLSKVARAEVKIRPGFHELVAYCRRKDYRFVIVSNGLDFYINTILRDIGVEDIEVFAAQTRFHPDGLKVQYIGPDGRQLDDAFKEAYANSFLREDYRIIYVGNGTSDISPARRCHYIFATSNLLTHCKKLNLNCTPFIDLNDVVRGLELLG